MKGFVKGSLWGLVLGISGLSFASLVSEQPQFATGPSAPQLVAPQLEVVAPTPPETFDADKDTAPAFAPATPLDDVVETSDVAPEVSTEPAALPETAEVAAAIDRPETPAEIAVTAEDEAPATLQEETALTTPEVEVEAPEVDTAPAATPPSILAAEEPAVAPEAEEADATPNPQAVEQEEANVAEAPAREEDTVPAAAQTPVAPAQDDASTATDTTSTGEAEVAETEAVTLPQTTTAVRINRPGAAEDEPADEPVEATEAEAIPDDAPALLRYAVPFQQTATEAKISIILIDSGEMPNAVAAISDLGFVPTVTVNALSPASPDLAAAYRAAGVEVAMQAALPQGAQPVDVEVAFEAALGTVPDVAMLFSDGTGAMQNRAVTAQVMQILAADGYGFVTVQRGLSNAARAAEQAGVSAATILRDIDGNGEDARAIVRGLDQAAFRARQTGNAVLLGRVRPETLSALRDWAAELDQDTLAIVPVSAVLLDGGEAE